jgi:hypothetical protein
MWSFLWRSSRIEDLIRRIAIKKPYGMRVRLTVRRDQMLVYVVTAAPPVDQDVVSRRLTVSVNGETDQYVEYPADTTQFGELSFEQGDEVTLALSDVDDAGNVSVPALLEFVASDTIPPSKPGSFGVTLVREEF